MSDIYCSEQCQKLDDGKDYWNFVCYSPDGLAHDGLVANIVGMTFFAIFTISAVVISILWYKKRDQFPLKQRSTYLSFLLLLSSYVHLCIVPIQSIYLYQLFYNRNKDYFQNLFVQSGDVIFWCPCWKGDRFLDIMQYLFVFVFFLYPMIYYIQTIRLFYAFNPSINRRFFNRIFRNEWLLVVISILLAGILTVIPYQSIQLPLESQNNELFSDYTMEYLQMSQILILSVLLYLMRNVNQQYAITSEIIVIIITTLPFKYLGFPFLNNNRNGCQESVYVNIATSGFRNVSLIVLSLIIPMLNSVDARIPLPYDIILENFSYFIQEEQCLDIFNLYLEHFDRHQLYKSQLSSINSLNSINNLKHCSVIDDQSDISYQQYLRYFLDCRLMQFSKNETKLQQIFEEYILSKGHSESVDSSGDNQYTFVFNQSTLVQDQEEFLFNVIQKQYNVIHDLLNTVFEKDYKQTKSFHYLSLKLKNNREITQNLNDLNMTVDFDMETFSQN